MPTGRYNLIQLDSLYLTSDGTSGGLPCRTEVSGLDSLSAGYTGNTVFALDGTPFNQVQAVGAGEIISIKIFVVSESVLDSLKSLVSTSLSTSSDINLIITGDTGDFDLDVKPMFNPLPLQFTGEFQSGLINDVTLNFTVTAIN